MAITLQELLVKISADITDYSSGMKGIEGSTAGVESSVSKLGGSLETLTGGLDKMGSSLTRVGGMLTAAITVPLVGVGVAALKVAGDLEQAKIAFTGMMGSADAAQKHLDALRDFAMKTPFEFTDLVTASKKLQAYGFAANDVIPILTKVGDAASRLGLGADGINRITLALGQMQAKGKVSAQDMNQLADTGLRVWPMLAEAVSKAQGKVVSVAETMKMAEKNMIDGAVAAKVLIDAMGAQAKGSMEDQSKSFNGMVSNLVDAAKKSLAEIGTALLPLGKSIVGSLANALPAISTLIEKFGHLPVAVQGGALAFAALAAAAGPALMIIGQMSTGVSASIKAFTAIQAVLNGASLFGSLTTGAAAATSAVAATTTAVTGLTGGFTALSSTTATFGSGTAAFGSMATAAASAEASVASLGVVLAAAGSALSIIAGTAGAAGGAIFGIRSAVGELFTDATGWAGTKIGILLALINALRNNPMTSGLGIGALVALEGQKPTGPTVDEVRNLPVKNPNIPGVTTPALPSTFDIKKLIRTDPEAAAKAAEKAARQFAAAMETVGLAAKNSEKLHTALALVAKGFDAGKISAEQYGEAISNVIDKELKAGEQLKNQSFSGSLDKATALEFRDALAEVDREFAKGQISVGEYVDRLRTLQAQMAAASGTSLQVGLKGLGIVSDAQLADAAKSAEHYFSMVVNSGRASAEEFSKAWQKAFDAFSQVDPRLIALRGLNIIPVEQLAKDAAQAQRYFQTIANSAKSTFGESAAASEAAWQKFFNLLTSISPRLTALKDLGILPVEKLQHEAELAQKSFQEVLDSANSTAGEIAAAFEKAWKAAFDLKTSKSPLLTGLKGLSVTSDEELEHVADSARKNFARVASDAKASVGEVRDAFEAMRQAVAASQVRGDDYTAALNFLGIPNEGTLQKAVDRANAALAAIKGSAKANAVQMIEALDAVWQAENNQRIAKDPSLGALARLNIPSDAQLAEATKVISGFYDNIAGNAKRSLREVDAAWQLLFAAREKSDPTLAAFRVLGIPSEEELNHATQMAIDAYNEILAAHEKGSASQFMLDKARLVELQKIVANNQAMGIGITPEQSKEIIELQKQQAKSLVDVYRSVYSEIGDAIKGVFGKTFEELGAELAHGHLRIANIIKAARTGLFEEMGQLAEDALKGIAKPLTDWLTKTISDAVAPIASKIASTLGITAIGALGKAGVQGLSAAEQAGADAARQATLAGITGGGGAAASTAASAGSAASKAATAATSSVMNTIGALGSAASAISGIIGNFQNAKMETTLNAIEHNTRFTEIIQEEIKNGQGHLSSEAWTLHEQLLAKLDYIAETFATWIQDLEGVLRSGLVFSGVGSEVSKVVDKVVTAFADGMNKGLSNVVDAVKDKTLQKGIRGAGQVGAGTPEALGEVRKPFTQEGSADDAKPETPATTSDKPEQTSFEALSRTPLPSDIGTQQAIMLLNQTTGTGLAAILEQLKSMTSLSGGGGSNGAAGSGDPLAVIKTALSFMQSPEEQANNAIAAAYKTPNTEFYGQRALSALNDAFSAGSVDELVAAVNKLPPGAKDIAQTAISSIDKNAKDALKQLQNALSNVAQDITDNAQAAAGSISSAGQGAAEAVRQVTESVGGMPPVLTDLQQQLVALGYSVEQASLAITQNMPGTPSTIGAGAQAMTALQQQLLAMGFPEDQVMASWTVNPSRPNTTGVNAEPDSNDPYTKGLYAYQQQAWDPNYSPVPFVPEYHMPFTYPVIPGTGAGGGDTIININEPVFTDKESMNYMTSLIRQAV